MAVSNTQIRTETHDLVNVDPLGRKNVVFSDGYVGALLQENYGHLRFYIKNSASPGSGWTEIDISSETPQYAACTVDDDDNVHICYRDGNDPNKVKYQMLERTGLLTFTIGPFSTVHDSGTGTIDGLAIEILGSGSGDVSGTGVPLIVAHVMESGGDGRMQYTIRRTSDDTWIAPIEHTLNNTVVGTEGSGSVAEPCLVSVARDLTGIVSSNCKFAVAITSKKNSRCDILGVDVDTVTGAEVTFKTIYGDLIPSSRGHRIGEIFSTGNQEWTFGGLFYDPSGRMNKIAAKFNWSGALFTPKNQLLSSGKYTYVSTTFSGVTYRWHMGGVQYTNGKLVFVWQQNVQSTKNYLWHHLATVGSTNVTWGNDTQASLHTVPFRGIHAGGVNRNFDKKLIMLYEVLINVGTTFLKWGVFNLPPSTAIALDKPVNGSTVNTDIPVFQTIIDGFDFVLGGGIRFKPIWEAASSTDFLTNFRTFELPDSVMAIGGTFEMAVPVIQELSQGTWYGRQKFKDEFGLVGAVGPYSTFTVAHVPSTSGHVPTGNQTVNAAAPRLDWNFFDTSPTDSQSAFQVVVERNSDGLVIVDSTKTTSTNTFFDPTISGIYNGVQLRWKVRVWDSDDVVSAYSGYQTFTLYTSPSVVMTSIEAGTPAPLVDWAYTAGTAGGQTHYRVSAKRVSTNEVVHDTGWVFSGTTQHQIVPPIMLKGVQYQFTVQVRDAAGLVGTVTALHTPTWTGAAQPTFTVDVSRFESEGFNKISWAGAPAAGFIAWRVYRRPFDGDWERIAQVTGGPLNIIDFLARSAETVDYIVVQVTDLDGAEVESDYTTILQVTPMSSHYWLIDPDETGMSEEAHAILTDPVSTMLAHVVDDPFQEEYEEEMHKIIGRGVRREVGTRWGFSGEIRAQLRGLASLSPREERLRLEELRATGKEMYLRNPFGDLWLVALGTLKYKRIPGVGTREFTEVSLPYQEVS